MLGRFFQLTALLSLGFLGLLFISWAAGALWFDLPVDPVIRKILTILFISIAAFFAIFGKRSRRLIAFALPAMVAVWWLSIRPSNQRDWKSEVTQTAWAEIHGDEVTLHNFRNFDYRTDCDFTPVWEARKVNLSKITGIDLAINYWGSPYMAHPIASFQFADGPPVCFSIETRMEKGELYSAVGGIYRQYELIYIVADERDVIRVRTNYRKGEEIYLYRLTITPEAARERFNDYLAAINELRDRPKWYNAVTNNCTTNIRTQHDQTKRRPWDWRILVNGFADEMLYEAGGFHQAGLPFTSLKKQSKINASAKDADASPDFSRLIRSNVPSFSQVGGK